MKNNICLFEDEGYSNLLPLVYLRPVYDLRCGILTLREKIEKRLPKHNLILHTRDYLADVMKERYPKLEINSFKSEQILFVNGRLILDGKTAKAVSKLKLNSALTQNGDVVAVNLDKQNIKNVISNSGVIDFNNLDTAEIECTLIKYPWELVNENSDEIKNDFELLTKNKKSAPKNFKDVVIKNKKNVFIEKGVNIDPFVFIDAASGPVYIGKNANVMSHSSLEGPLFLGENSTIKMHASIYHGTSIGETCKVGGEVEATIIHSYSNKQHEGYLGHSYLGSWVNIGASTNNSDLKNNYANVEVFVNGKQVDSGSQFVGLIMGDHSKTAINTMFNTGSVVGISCNIFGAGFPARYIPSFVWGGSDFLRTYHISKSLEVADIVTKRRYVALSDNEKKLLEKIFEMTEADRNTRNMH